MAMPNSSSRYQAIFTSSMILAFMEQRDISIPLALSHQLSIHDEHGTNVKHDGRFRFTAAFQCECCDGVFLTQCYRHMKVSAIKRHLAKMIKLLIPKGYAELLYDTI
jgi:hypothetical protein